MLCLFSNRIQNLIKWSLDCLVHVSFANSLVTRIPMRVFSCRTSGAMRGTHREARVSKRLRSKNLWEKEELGEDFPKGLKRQIRSTSKGSRTAVFAEHHARCKRALEPSRTPRPGAPWICARSIRPSPHKIHRDTQKLRGAQKLRSFAKERKSCISQKC